jgi:hypothetical protein
MTRIQKPMHQICGIKVAIIPNTVELPDNAKVWRPPAATEAILTPGFSVTRHGNAERDSSPDDELSAACFADDILLRFVLSSPPPLASALDTVPPVDREA